MELFAAPQGQPASSALIASNVWDPCDGPVVVKRDGRASPVTARPAICAVVSCSLREGSPILRDQPIGRVALELPQPLSTPVTMAATT